MKKFKTEFEVEIKTLTDQELLKYAPPIISNKKTVTTDHRIKNVQNITTDNNQNSTTSKNPLSNRRNTTIVTTTNEFLGVGGFSKVYKFSGDIEKKAIKKISLNPKIYSAKLTIVDSVKREIYGLLRCACEHSVKLLNAFQSQGQDNFYLLMEQCQGNLEQLINILNRPLKSCEIKEILIQLNEVFFLLFKYNIIHRDIKPTNILYTDLNANDENFQYNEKLPFGGKKYIFKLTDYGVCLPLYDKQYSISQFMGTLDFMAPEIYDKKTTIELPIYTTKIDLFSLGESILNVMGFIKKARPLDYKTIANLRKENTLFEGNYQDQLLADLIFNGLLVPDPEDRLSWEMYFLHPFFENYEDEMKDEENGFENVNENGENKDNGQKN